MKYAFLTMLSVAAAAHGGAFLEDRPGWEKLNASDTPLEEQGLGASQRFVLNAAGPAAQSSFVVAL